MLFNAFFTKIGAFVSDMMNVLLAVPFVFMRGISNANDLVPINTSVAILFVFGYVLNMYSMRWAVVFALTTPIEVWWPAAATEYVVVGAGVTAGSILMNPSIIISGTTFSMQNLGDPALLAKMKGLNTDLMLSHGVKLSDKANLSADMANFYTTCIDAAGAKHDEANAADDEVTSEIEYFEKMKQSFRIEEDKQTRIITGKQAVASGLRKDAFSMAILMGLAGGQKESTSGMLTAVLSSDTTTKAKLKEIQDAVDIKFEQEKGNFKLELEAKDAKLKEERKARLYWQGNAFEVSIAAKKREGCKA